MRGMKVLVALLLIGGAVLSLAACGTSTAEEPEAITQTQPTSGAVVGAPTIEPPTVQPVITDTIMSVLEADGRFTKLVELIGTAGMSETLAGPGEFTVFAPTDEAFGALDPTVLQDMTPDQLKSFVLGHVVNGKLSSTDIAMLADTELDTMAGTKLLVTVDGERVLVGDAQIIEPDVQASNGVIHVVDVVLVSATAVPEYTATP